MAAMLERTIDRQFLTTKSMTHFPTEIMHNGPIFSLSDIHGDIHAFIISLRDCAKVIRKKTSSTPLNPDIVDPDIERNLIINIGNGVDGVYGAAGGGAADVGTKYDVSLGYEWCGGNAHVVICGDFIDPNRQQNEKPTCSKHPCVNGIPCNCTYYPQQEIKLLLFIIELNRQAMLSSGRIIKLLGNHEVKNILPGELFYHQYIFSLDIKLGKSYYLGCDRKETFNIGNPGYNLLFKDGCGLIIKINNTIFVHGKINKEVEHKDVYFELGMTLETINNTNQMINDIAINKRMKKIVFTMFDYDNQILNDRTWGLDDIYKKIDFQNKEYDSRNAEESDPRMAAELSKVLTLDEFNKDVKDTIRYFLSLNPEEDISKFRVIIGHCTQFDSSTSNVTNTTFSNVSHEDDKSKTYNGLTYKRDKPNFDNQDFIFGITMEVPKERVNGLIDFYLYRVDVGSSREFDKGDKLILYLHDNIQPGSIQAENKLLFSKTPQVLAIHKDNHNNDIVTIIKSKMWNTRKHLPRQFYEHLIAAQTYEDHQINQGLKTLTDRINYDKKYLKYKKKYLDLKKSN